MSAAAGLQVKAEKDRLIDSRLIAESEKRLYVKVRSLLTRRGAASNYKHQLNLWPKYLVILCSQTDIP